jgi:hypothetical protein
VIIQYGSHGSEGVMNWNCTEVYQRFGTDWKIVHSRWSFTKPAPPKQEGWGANRGTQGNHGAGLMRTQQVSAFH